MTLPIAHAAHWAASLLYATPIVVAFLVLRLQAHKDRRANNDNNTTPTPNTKTTSSSSGERQ